jgi:hypothetical protein
LNQKKVNAVEFIPPSPKSSGVKIHSAARPFRKYQALIFGKGLFLFDGAQANEVRKNLFRMILFSEKISRGFPSYQSKPPGGSKRR